MMESVRIQFQVVLGELKAFVNDFLGEERPSLPACPYHKDIDHVLKCQMGCMIRISANAIEESVRENKIQILLEKLGYQDKTIAYIDCWQNISLLSSQRCHLILSPGTAEDAFKMCLKLIEFQAASVVVLDSWFKLPLQAEENAPLFQNNGLERHQFFEKAMTRLAQNAQKNLTSLLLID